MLLGALPPTNKYVGGQMLAQKESKYKNKNQDVEIAETLKNEIIKS